MLDRLKSIAAGQTSETQEKMLWLVQKDFYREQNEHALIRALVTLEKPYSLVDVRRSNQAWHCSPVEGGSPAGLVTNAPIVTMGNSHLAGIAQREGWKPGSWNSNLDYTAWRQALPQHLLNANADVVEFADLKLAAKSFVRPVHDNKAFSGRVFGPSEWADFQATAIETYRSASDKLAISLSPTMQVAFGALQEIFVESRVFVVDSEIVASSVYRRGGRPSVDSIVDEEVVLFVGEIISKWVPNPAFVVDIAQTPVGPKIVEFNSLNASGFYQCDVTRIVSAVETFVAGS